MHIGTVFSKRPGNIFSEEKKKKPAKGQYLHPDEESVNKIVKNRGSSRSNVVQVILLSFLYVAMARAIARSGPAATMPRSHTC